MTDTTVNLGGFIFENMEIPQDLPLGGDQSLKIHKLVGGQRVIDALGSDEGEITWEGLMLGPDALDRALQLDSMRAAGLQLNFSVFSCQYNVVISKFTFTPERYYQVKYRISLAVVENLSIQTGISNVLSFTDSILSDFASANTLSGLINNSSITSAMGNLNTAIGRVPSFDTASLTQLNSVSTQISAVQTQLTSKLSSLKTNLFGS